MEDHDDEADLAIPVGLPVNAFVTNSFKHAFGAEGGRVELRLGAQGDALRLEMADDGSGLPEGFGKASGVSGTGARIIARPAAQIGGGAKWLDGPGRRLAVRFPAG